MKVIETSERFKHFRSDYIKRYCQKIDITNIDFIKGCIYEYLDEKWNRNDVKNMLSKFSGFNIKRVDFLVKNNKTEFDSAINKIAMYISDMIKNRNLILKPIRYFDKMDEMSGKIRRLGIEEPLHQICDYIAVNGAKEMLNAKIGIFQCASLPNKGQSYGKKCIEKWVNKNEIKYYVKGDIKKCFESINISKMKELINRDIKNKTLVWFISTLLDMFEKGLSIGSYLSQYFCNYYLSYAYHFASEKLFKIRKTKNGDKNIRLINHVLFYMDDFILTSNNKKYLKMAMKLIIKYLKDFLSLTVKPNWKLCIFSDAEPIDMMGFVFRKFKTTIREKIFIKTRKKFLKFKKLSKSNKTIPIKLAYQIISAFGWYKHTDSFMIRVKLNIDKILKISKRIVSLFSREVSYVFRVSQKTDGNFVLSYF